MNRPLALVTGGCRRLGAAIARALAADGFDLALHSGPGSAPEPGLVSALEAAGAAWAHLTADLADEGAVRGLLPAVRARFGRAPDLLVNNAARFAYDAPGSATGEAMLGHYMVNCAAPLLLAQALAAAPGDGRVVVNILDQRIAAPNADQLSYTLSKLALAELTAILARHYGARLRVCGVAPGLTLPTEDYGDATIAAAAAAMPLARLPAPEEIAEAVRWLARAGSVTGQILYVDAGAHLCRYDRDFLFMGSRDG